MRRKSEDIVLKIERQQIVRRHKALHGVDFELRRGEIHAIAGENGAGKSTLMNIIDGILRPDSGEIHLNGEAVEITSPARAQELGIGFVHQEIALCPDMTVAENIFMAEINASRKWFMDFRTSSRGPARRWRSSARSTRPSWSERYRSPSSSWSKSPRR